MTNDSISRRSALDALCDNCDNVQAVCAHYPCKQYKAFEGLPPVQPEPKKGNWIHGRELGREMIGDCITAIFYEGWKCSACGCTVEEERQPLWNFCPACGAEMRGEEG